MSIYVDVWCSLNGRFQQRMYDPNYDLLTAKWSPFKPVEWLLPVLTEYNNFRSKMSEISEEVYGWSNYSDVLFIADFPGLYLENFIKSDLKNVTLTVLIGEVIYEVENEFEGQSMGVKLRQGDSLPIDVGIFHKIHTISKVPSCYMYTYVRDELDDDVDDAANQPIHGKRTMYSPFPLVENIPHRLDAFQRMLGHISHAFMHLFSSTMTIS